MRSVLAFLCIFAVLVGCTGDTVKYQHDALGRLVSMEATGVSQGFGWDHLDRPVLRRLGQREWTTTWHSGRAATQTPAGDSVAVRYDGRGRPYRVEQQSVGGSSEQSFSTRTMTYDGDDQLRKAAGIDAQGAATEVVIHRDATGRVLMLEQPAGVVGYTTHHPSQLGVAAAAHLPYRVHRESEVVREDGVRRGRWICWWP